MMDKTFKEKLFELQNEIGSISKSKENPFYNSKYFDINELLRQLKPLLQKHRLILKQPIVEGTVYSIIEDVDSDNQEASGMELNYNGKPQEVGSEVTYYRRYTLQSLLALEAEDDDANKTVQTPKKRNLKPGNQRWAKAVHSVAKGEVDIDYVKKNYNITDKDAERLVTESMEVANGQ